LAGRKRRVVAADRHQGIDFQAAQDVDDVSHVFRILGRIGARRAEDRAALKVDEAGVGNGELANAAGITLDQPFEAVLAAQHFDAVVDRLDGDGADDAIEPRRWAAATSIKRRRTEPRSVMRIPAGQAKRPLTGWCRDILSGWRIEV